MVFGTEGIRAYLWGDRLGCGIWILLKKLMIINKYALSRF